MLWAMGGGQSQERVVNVEGTTGEDGAPKIIVTEDFIEYLHDRQTESEGGAGGRGEESHDSKGESRDQEDRLSSGYDEEATPYYVRDENEKSAESANRPKYSSAEADRWRMKYELEKQKNQLLKDTSDKEFERVTTDIREKLNSTQQPTRLVCEDYKNKVLECYRSNPGRTLNCSTEVKEYTKCIEQARRRILESTGTPK